MSKRIVFRWVLAGLASTLVGCGAFVPVADLNELSPEQKQAYREVKIYDEQQLEDKNYDILSVVEGNSCKNQLYDPPATRTAAVDQLKYYAYEGGADGIKDI